MRQPNQMALTAVVTALLLAVPAVAQEPELGADQPFPQEKGWPEPLEVEFQGTLSSKIGFGRLATLPDEVERVAVADDGVARVQIISPREIMLTGLQAGSTSVHVWLESGRRLSYVLEVRRDLEALQRALRDLDPDIAVEDGHQGASIVLYGAVRDHRTAQQAVALSQAFLGGQGEVLNLLQYPGRSFNRDDRLAAALQEIDPRIRIRRIQVGEEPDAERDTYILEGRVRTISQLMKAMMIAERQLGGTGGEISAMDAERLQRDRTRGFYGNFMGFGGGVQGGQNALQALRGQDPRSSSLATLIARGMVLTSESGRVVSTLEVDELPQISVSIRVMEVDRAKTKKAGINFRIDSEKISIGNYTSPGVTRLPAGDADIGALNEAGNIVASFVDQTTQIMTAIDFLQQKNFARSVAEPNILTLSGELASVLVGGEIPIETTAVGNVAAVQGVFFQEFGVRLDIRPTLDDGGTVALEVAPSIVRPSISLAVGQTPGFTVQTVQTTARVPAGQSLVIGGLLSFEEGLEDRRLPGLGVIPLFRWKQRTRQERELIFVITPNLVSIAEQEPLPAIEAEDHEDLELPPMDWEQERKLWRQEFNPRTLDRDGVPPEFRRYGEQEEAEEAEYEETEYYEEDLGDEGVGDWEETGEEGLQPVAMEEMTAEPGVTGVWVVQNTATPCLNLRPQPRMWTQPMDCVEPGTEVESLGERGGWEWIKVRTYDGREGWMAGSYLAPKP